jgi:hypothetical protein
LAELQRCAGQQFDPNLIRQFQQSNLADQAQWHHKAASKWNKEWDRFLDCGLGLSVLAAWLRCLALGDEGKRCEVCYRHLGPGMKRFCVVHVRRAHMRQNTRDLHLSAVHRRVLPALLEAKGVQELVDSVNLVVPVAPEREMLEAAKAAGLPAELWNGAAMLASQLRRFWPVIGPVLSDEIADHFSRMLDAAKAPFSTRAGSAGELAQLGARRRDAQAWLSWESFFETWFGPEVSIPFAPQVMLGRSLDADHPIVHGGATAPARLALDLAHYWCWTAGDDALDRYAYLDIQRVAQLRLQQTVEGLSIAAVTYYVVGLFGYVFKGLKDAGQLPVAPEIATAAIVPLTLLIIALLVRRIRNRHIGS